MQKKIQAGEKLGRKVYNKRIDDEVVDKIVKFYECDTTSRIDMRKNKHTKKWGPRRYMYTTIKIAHLNFITKNPEMKVSFSTFHKLRPRNVKISKDTPLISSLCPYCHNIRLKLQKLNIPGLRTEYDLYHHLICEKDRTKVGNASCIKQQCKICRDWKGKVEILLSNAPDQDKEITWYTWTQKVYTSKNGQRGVRRELERKTESFEIFKQELMKDILKPVQRCSFVEHHFSHRYQHKMYDECIASLKPGQCLMVQDFAKNRDIIFQDDIKSNFWCKKQVTIHPGVIFYRLIEGEPIRKLVVTHLSDIKNHDAHMVHLMTRDCISIMNDKYPEIEWNRFIIWSDGCASQYKGKNSFYYLGKYSVSLERNFFASEHGKGPSDAETGLLAMKLEAAIKTREAVIDNAKSMYDFFIEKHDKETHLFKLVEECDLEAIMSDFKGVTVQTLTGKCTRSLHQIKTNNRQGDFLQRPFSWFCSCCKIYDFGNCKNKEYTNGHSIKCKLPTNSIIDMNDDEVDTEDYYDDIAYNFNDMLTEEIVDDIQIEEEDLRLEHLKVEDFVIVAIPGTKENIVSHFLYKITECNANGIYGDWFKQNYDHPDVFKETDEKETLFDLKQIIMILPEPRVSRGRYIFPGNIELKENVKYY